MDNTSSTNWKNVIIFAGAYCGFMIGSGFATGQEIMQFFTSFGSISMVAMVISLVLFSTIGGALMVNGYKTKNIVTESIYKYYCGNIIGTIFDWFVILFLFSVAVIMISGAGAVFEEYYHLSKYIGSAIMAGFMSITVLMGLKKTINIIGSIGPIIIIIITIVVGVVSIFNNADGLTSANHILDTIEVPRATKAWWLAGILYPAYAITGAVPFFNEMGSTANNKKEAILGGVLGGVAFMSAAMAVNLGILANVKEVYDKAVPVLVLADKILPFIGMGFSFILLAGIYTTGAPMLWTVCSKFAKENTRKYKVITLVLIIIAFAGGLLPFGKLVGTVYPFTGYMGICIILAIVYKQFTNMKETKCRIG